MTMTSRPSIVAEAIAALCQVAPDGKELAEKWLAKPPSDLVGWNRHLFGRHPLDEVVGRAWSWESLAARASKVIV